MTDAYTFAARLREPSTWSSIAILLGLAGIHLAPDTWTAVVSIGTGLAAVAGALLPERVP